MLDWIFLEDLCDTLARGVSQFLLNGDLLLISWVSWSVALFFFCEIVS
jgi:hypothetical protein